MANIEKLKKYADDMENICGDRTSDIVNEINKVLDEISIANKPNLPPHEKQKLGRIYERIKIGKQYIEMGTTNLRDGTTDILNGLNNLYDFTKKQDDKKNT